MYSDEEIADIVGRVKSSALSVVGPNCPIEISLRKPDEETQPWMVYPNGKAIIDSQSSGGSWGNYAIAWYTDSEMEIEFPLLSLPWPGELAFTKQPVKHNGWNGGRYLGEDAGQTVIGLCCGPFMRLLEWCRTTRDHADEERHDVQEVHVGPPGMDVPYSD
jgi:hypothetical protein